MLRATRTEPLVPFLKSRNYALLLALPLAASAQNHPHPATQKSGVQKSDAQELPITHVSLYKNGVGFFEHSGRVTGDQSVTIDFTSAQLNDVLQSLTAIDLNGGRISGAGYNSTTPLDQQLKTLPLDLSGDPSDVDFYNSIRGARVSVTGPGLALTGRILSIDLRPDVPKSQADDSESKANRRFLTVVSDAGATRTFELTSAVTVRLLDSALETDVNRYLELLANNRSQGLRHLTLLDRGTGSRDLRVSYISEVPVWKSTYRILFTDSKDPKATATLQGWSVVDNTTGTDWINVHLDLIAGAPQSFIQPLSTPLYTRRPEIPIAQDAQLTPQTFDSGNAPEPPAPPPEPKIASANETVEVSAAAPMQMMLLEPRGRGVGGAIGGGVARVAPGAYADLAQNSIAPQTTTAAFDDFFEYSLTDPITIRKNESALVPILQTKLPIERVTLWSPQQPVALRALWLTNASNLTLDRGSFSIVESGNFGGEGLLDPIHPNEKRLLSYAADQAVRVDTSRTNNTRKVQRLTVSKGVLTEVNLDVTELTYNVHNAAPDTRTVILEHPIHQGYTLDSTPKPEESTPTVDRFRVIVAPGATEHLHVGERRVASEYIRLTDRSEDQLILLLQNAKVSPAALQQFQPVFDAHHAVVALDQQIAAAQGEINTITRDQDRLRENLKSLKGTPEEKALATRYTGELNAQEDRLAALNQQIASLKTQREAADQDFRNKLAAVSFDETL